MINPILQHIIESSDDVQAGYAIQQNPNKVVQLDSDGTAYHVANPHKSLESNFKGLCNYIEDIRQTCGAGYVWTHTTMYLKGGRNEMAYYQTYQRDRGNGMDPAIRERVSELRKLLHNYQTDIITPKPQWYTEADDSMSVWHNKLIAEAGDDTISIIASGDKDLRMNCGQFYCLNDRKFSVQGRWTPNGWEDSYGHAEAVRPTGKHIKLTGRGTALFWAQMLCGDKADNIAGLPKMYGEHLDYYSPLKKGRRKPHETKACGIALACKVATTFQSDSAAYRAVAAAYKRHFGKDWDFFLFENAFLLWMRKSYDVLDVLNFLKPLGFDYQLHPHQHKALQEYMAKCVQFNKENNL